MTSILVAAYVAVSVYCVLLVMYVMRKADHDGVLQREPVNLRRWRRRTFLLMSATLCSTALIILKVDWEPSAFATVVLAVLDLVIAEASVLLTVNAISLHYRGPPEALSQGIAGRTVVARRGAYGYARDRHVEDA